MIQAAPKSSPDLLDVNYRDWPQRKLDEKTLRHFDIGFHDSGVVFGYHDAAGRLVAQKVKRRDGKGYYWVGDKKHSGPQIFGAHLWPESGKFVTITEGETDAPSAAQGDDCKWPVGSISHGAGSAVDSIKKHLEQLSKFDKVVLMFDMDEPGRKAAEECAAILPPGKAFIAKFPTGFKDASDCLQAGQGALIKKAFWDAKAWRPDGIIDGDDFDSLLEDFERPTTAKWWHDGLNYKLDGLRMGELNLVTAGTGAGKSEFCKEQAMSLVEQGFKVGYIALEENPKKTLATLISKKLSAKCHKMENPKEYPGFLETKDFLKGKLSLYNHDWGKDGLERIFSKINYMAVCLGVQYVFFDHLSIAVSGIETTDERKLIDIMMTKLVQLVNSTGVGVVAVCHLRKPSEGKGHEEGREVRQGDLRGSHGLSQMAYQVLALERNQQAEDPHQLTMRVLKDRWDGSTGEAGSVKYDPATGRMSEPPIYS